MVVIPKYETSVTLFSRNGGVWTYASKAEAVRELGWGWISRNVGEQFFQFHYESVLTLFETDETGAPRIERKPVYRYADFIMRDDMGRPLLAWNFSNPANRRARNRYAWRDETWNGEGPVPGISRNRPSVRRYRRPRYVGLLRDAQYFPEEGEVALRIQLVNEAFSDPWHEIGRDGRNRNWKKFRKTQWKDKA